MHVTNKRMGADLMLTVARKLKESKVVRAGLHLALASRALLYHSTACKGAMCLHAGCLLLHERFDSLADQVWATHCADWQGSPRPGLDPQHNPPDRGLKWGRHALQSVRPVEGPQLAGVVARTTTRQCGHQVHDRRPDRPECPD